MTYGIWDCEHGWSTHSGRIIISEHPDKLWNLAIGPHQSVREFPGFVEVRDVGSFVDAEWGILS